MALSQCLQRRCELRAEPLTLALLEREVAAAETSPEGCRDGESSPRIETGLRRLGCMITKAGKQLDQLWPAAGVLEDRHFFMAFQQLKGRRRRVQRYRSPPPRKLEALPSRSLPALPATPAPGAPTPEEVVNLALAANSGDQSTGPPPRTPVHGAALPGNDGLVSSSSGRAAKATPAGDESKVVECLLSPGVKRLQERRLFMLDELNRRKRERQSKAAERHELLARRRLEAQRRHQTLAHEEELVLSELKLQHAATERALGETRVQLLESQTQVADLELRLQDLTEEREAQELQVLALRENVESLTDSHLMVEEELGATTSSLSVSEALVAKADKYCTSLQQDLSSLTAAHAVLKDHATTKLAEADCILQNVEALAAQNQEKLQMQLLERNEQVQSLGVIVQALQRELSTSLQENANLSAKMLPMEEECAHAQLTVQSLCKERDAISTEAQAALNKAAELSTRSAQLEETLTASQAERERSACDVRTLNEQLSQSKQQVEILTGQLERLQREKEDEVAKGEAAAKERDQFQEEAEASLQQVQAVQRENAELSEMAEEAQTEAELWKEELSQWEARHAELMKSVNTELMAQQGPS